MDDKWMIYKGNHNWIARSPTGSYSVTFRSWDEAWKFAHYHIDFQQHMNKI